MFQILSDSIFFVLLIYGPSVKCYIKADKLLHHYFIAQGQDPVKRVQELFSLMPAMRHVVMWHKQLMKKMKTNIDVQEVTQVFKELSVELPKSATEMQISCGY